MSSTTTSIRPGMTCSDYIGFAAMTLLVIGAANWLTVAIRYSADALPTQVNGTELLTFDNGHQLYAAVPTPDLLDLLTAPPIVQIVIYYAVGVAGVVYLALFVYNSIEFRTTDA